MNFTSGILSTDKTRAVAKDVAIIFAGFITLAFLARVSLPLPFTPVPITLSTLGVYLLASTLGARRAVWAVAIYIIAGGFGAPIFSNCRFGINFLVGISGGYIIGYGVSAAFIGYMFDKGRVNNTAKSIVILTLGAVILFSCGLIQLSFFVPSGKVLAYGLYPFIPGEVFKICLAASLVKPIRKFIKI